eukprot:16058-Pleurochrysis_carterae.AAC.1
MFIPCRSWGGSWGRSLPKPLCLACQLGRRADRPLHVRPRFAPLSVTGNVAYACFEPGSGRLMPLPDGMEPTELCVCAVGSCVALSAG